jgi:ATP-dependent helicase/nuclease subunit B
LQSSQVFTIAPNVPFVDELASGVLARYGGDPLTLSNVTILLPNLRSVRALREAFLRQTHGKALLLPAMRAIGDYDEVSLAFYGAAESVANIPDAISPLRRRILLADLIMELGAKQRAESSPINVEQAHYLAYDLATFLDDVDRYDLGFESLYNIVPEELSEHWQITLDFFSLISEKWPEKLQELSLMDPWKRKHLLAEKQVEAWQNNPIKHPFIIAGTTGSLPSTYMIIKEILNSKNGYLVLPSLDQVSDDNYWLAIDEQHPQYGMRELLKALEIDRDDVHYWGEGRVNERAKFWSEVMRPEAVGSGWQNLDLSPNSIEGIEQFCVPTSDDEARVIALMMRKQLDYAGQTVALITNDRELAARVSGFMLRWNIEMDDSAGVALAETSVAVFLQLLLDAVVSDFAPVELLALLKHPLMHAGVGRGKSLSLARELDQWCLRGVRGESGLQALLQSIAQSRLNDERKKELCTFIETLITAFAPWFALLGGKHIRMADVLKCHVECAENLASGADLSGAERLWAGDVGDHVACFVSELLHATADMGGLDDVNDYGGLYASLWLGKKFRKPYGAHPRLHILSPMEARLQHFDLAILAGLNQGSWPAERNNPWMSKGMKKEFGLPSDGRMVGLSAHDFVTCASSPNVVLLRAEKVAGSPMVASPWLLRAEAVLDKAGLLNDVVPKDPWLAWAHMLHAPDKSSPMERPSPTPPLAARPHSMSVTNIERWMRDPYGVYAKYILGLRKMDDIDQDPGAAEFGNLIHNALEHFVNGFKGKDVELEHQRLIECGRVEFEGYKHKPAVERVWWTRFETIAGWFVKREWHRQQELKQVLTECSGELKLETDFAFTVTAKADRIEIWHGDEVRVVDYKTGTPPTKSSVAAGFAPQLSLEALIVETNGFDKVRGEVAALEYWKISTSMAPPVVIDVSGESDVLQDAIYGVSALVDSFADERTPYIACPDEKNAPAYNDYAHLERIKEWSTS